MLWSIKTNRNISSVKDQSYPNENIENPPLGTENFLSAETMLGKEGIFLFFISFQGKKGTIIQIGGTMACKALIRSFVRCSIGVSETLGKQKRKNFLIFFSRRRDTLLWRKTSKCHCASCCIFLINLLHIPEPKTSAIIFNTFHGYHCTKLILINFKFVQFHI